MNNRKIYKQLTDLEYIRFNPGNLWLSMHPNVIIEKLEPVLKKEGFRNLDVVIDKNGVFYVCNLNNYIG